MEEGIYKIYTQQRTCKLSNKEKNRQHSKVNKRIKTGHFIKRVS